MCFGGIPRWEDASDPQREDALVDLAAKSIKEGRVTRRIERRNRVDRDASFAGTAPSLERHESAAVGDAGKRPSIKACSVNETCRSRWQLAADRSTDVVARFDDEVSTETTHECFIRLGCRRENAQAVGLRQLDRIATNSTRAADDCDGGPAR
jgi:hypothetical protein